MYDLCNILLSFCCNYLFVNLELSQIQTWFYISVVFCKIFFRIKLCIATHLLYDVLMVDQMFTFKIELEHTFVFRKFSIADMT